VNAHNREYRKQEADRVKRRAPSRDGEHGSENHGRYGSRE